MCCKLLCACVVNVPIVGIVGAIDPSTLLTKFTLEELQLHHIQNQEFLRKMIEKEHKESGKRLYKMVSILDLNGIGMSHAGGR